MSLERRIRAAESRVFADAGVEPEESFVEVGEPRVRLRVLSAGAGTPLVFLHGVTLAAAAWATWLPTLPGHRAHLVELPGHGLSDPVAYRVGEVRGRALALLDGLLDALELPTAAIVGHSLGGMFALWYAAARPERVDSLVAIGAPAVALPGTAVRMPLSLLTVPYLGTAVLRSPTPRRAYRGLLAAGLGGDAAANASDALVELLRLSVRRGENARTVASLMHAINRFRRARPETVLADDELRRIAAPTLFCLGTGDPFLAPAQARPWVEKLPAGTLVEVRAGHAPWLDDPVACGATVREHLAETVVGPAA